MESPGIKQTLTIIYGAFLASTCVYVLVAVFLQTTAWEPASPQLSDILFVAFLVAAAGCAGLVVRQKGAFFKEGGPAPAGPFRQAVLSRGVVWCALSEVPSILGFVHFVLTGSLPALLVLCAISIAALTLARPSLSQLEEMERRTDPGAR